MKTKRTAILACMLVLAICLAMVFVACDNDGNTPKTPSTISQADVYVTTGTMSKLMSRESTLNFEAYESTDDLEMDGVVLSVDTNSKSQQFYGYGASLTHSSAYLLMQEGAEETADEMLNELFGKDGAHLGLVRIPIGASDYIEGDKFFTCDDLDDSNDTDWNLEHFSIAHDSNIIAVLKKIIAINPDVKIMACPWSAPAWMKDTGNLYGGSLDSACHDVYADYLVKFIEEYKKEGITISYLSLVNEPLVSLMTYPYMYLDEIDAISIVDRLAGKLAKKSLSVKVLGWEHNVEDSAFDYAETLFNGTSNVAGFAFHGYGDVEDYTVSEGCEIIRDTYPGKELFMTEITEHNGSNDFASNLSYAARYVTVDPLNYGLNGSLFWNLVLRQDGTPTGTAHKNNECYGVLDMDYKDGEFTYYKRSAYYAMAHVGKFAYPINGVYPTVLGVESSNESQILACALERADGAIVVCAVNISDQLSENVYVAVSGKSVMVELQPQSVVTFVLGSENGDSTETYEAQGISHVDIVQKSTNTYEYTVESDIAPSATSKVYVTRYDKISNDMTPVEFTQKDGKYVFTAEVKYDSYFIFVQDGDKTAMLPLTRPQMAPSLSQTDAGSVVLTYNFVNGTSWSSFCDPTGKSIYRSAKTVFDENAQLIAKNVNIFGVDSTTDADPSESEPYYYVVLSAKNGIVTYVSAPLMTVDKAYSDIRVELKNIEGVPYVQMSGKFISDGNVALEFYSADTKLGKVLEIVGDSVSGKAGENFTVVLDASQVVSGKSGAGIWYDIKIATAAGNLYELPADTADMSQTILNNKVTYEFKSWNNILKLNYEYYDFTATSVTIETIDGVPTLVVKGELADGVLKAQLHADYKVGKEDEEILWDNKSTVDGMFEFRVPLTDLPRVSGDPWFWFHVWTYKTETAHNQGDLNRGNALTIGQTFDYDGTRYTIKAYQDTGIQLAIEAK